MKKKLMTTNDGENVVERLPLCRNRIWPLITVLCVAPHTLWKISAMAAQRNVRQRQIGVYKTALPVTLLV